MNTDAGSLACRQGLPRHDVHGLRVAEDRKPEERGGGLVREDETVVNPRSSVDSREVSIPRRQLAPRRGRGVYAAMESDDVAPPQCARDVWDVDGSEQRQRAWCDLRRDDVRHPEIVSWRHARGGHPSTNRGCRRPSTPCGEGTPALVASHPRIRETAVTARDVDIRPTSRAPTAVSRSSRWMPRGPPRARAGAPRARHPPGGANTPGHHAAARGYPTNAITSITTWAMTSGITRPQRW